MAVAFPSGYSLIRAITISVDAGMEWTEMSDNSIRGVEVSPVSYTSIPARLVGLTQAELLTLLDFIKTNKAEEITWDIDGTSYIGRVSSKVDYTMRGNRFDVAFVYYARENV